MNLTALFHLDASLFDINDFKVNYFIGHSSGSLKKLVYWFFFLFFYLDNCLEMLNLRVITSIN